MNPPVQESTTILAVIKKIVAKKENEKDKKKERKTQRIYIVLKVKKVKNVLKYLGKRKQW